MIKQKLRQTLVNLFQVFVLYRYWYKYISGEAIILASLGDILVIDKQSITISLRLAYEVQKNIATGLSLNLTQTQEHYSPTVSSAS